MSATNVVPLPTLALYAAKAEVESLKDLEYLLRRVMYGAKSQLQVLAMTDSC